MYKPVKDKYSEPVTTHKMTEEETKRYSRCTGDERKIVKQYNLSYRPKETRG